MITFPLVVKRRPAHVGFFDTLSRMSKSFLTKIVVVIALLTLLVTAVAPMFIY